MSTRLRSCFFIVRTLRKNSPYIVNCILMISTNRNSCAVASSLRSSVERPGAIAGKRHHHFDVGTAAERASQRAPARIHGEFSTSVLMNTFIRQNSREDRQKDRRILTAIYTRLLMRDVYKLLAVSLLLSILIKKL